MSKGNHPMQFSYGGTKRVSPQLPTTYNVSYLVSPSQSLKKNNDGTAEVPCQDPDQSRKGEKNHSSITLLEKPKGL
jgi:hypothetical protein